MQFDPLFVSKPYPRNFSKAMDRLRPAFLGLQQCFGALVLPDEPVTQIVACLVRMPRDHFFLHQDSPPSRFSFVAGFGEHWTYRPDEDTAFLATVAGVLAAAMERPPRAAASRAALAAVARDWAGAIQRDQPPARPA